MSISEFTKALEKRANGTVNAQASKILEELLEQRKLERIATESYAELLNLIWLVELHKLFYNRPRL